MARHWRAGAAGLAVLGLTLTACGGAKVGDSSEAGGSGSSGKCGTFNLAVNPWVGYEADAAVVAYVAEHDLKCKVTKKDLKEEIAWQGFGTGEVDAILENWGHEDLKKKYITQQKTAVEAGPTGNKGVIGWFVPPWMVKKYPDITDWKNLKLNFKVVQGGSETSLIQSFRQAEEKKMPFIGYFYSPQWFFSEVPLVRVDLPKYTTGCDADPAKVACDYPDYDLDKIVSAKFAKSGSPAYDLVKKFHWTNDDQNTVAKYIAVDKMTPDAAAKKWVDANRDKVDAWLK